MAAIILPRRWTTQPSGFTGTDDKGVGEGLVLAINPAAGLYDQSSNKTSLSLVGTGVTLTGTPGGLAFGGFSAASYIGFNNPVGILSASVFALLQNGTTSDQGLWTLTSNAGSGHQDHLPYGGTIYSSALASERYISNIAVPGGYSRLLTPFSLAYSRKQGVAGVTYPHIKAYLSNSIIRDVDIAGVATANSAFRLGSNSQSTMYYSGKVIMFAMWKRELSTDEIFSLNANPWQIFKKKSQVLYFTTAGGAVTHESSGALSADSAVIAGSSLHNALHASSGALSAQSSVIAGASVHSIPHDSSGALSAQSATIAGSSTHIAIHASSGALSAQSAVIDGTGANTESGVVVHISSGALSAQSAVIEGTSAHVVNHQSSGALLASNAVVDGISIHNVSHVTSGDLIAGNAEIYGLYSGGTAAVSGGGIGHGGFKRKPRLIKIEEAENPEEVIAQIEQAFNETTKKPAKKLKNVVVKSKPVETKEEAPFDWLSYYQSQARQVKEQQDMNDLIAKARARINEIQEQDTLAKYQQMIIREEEEFLLLLMAA